MRTPPRETQLGTLLPESHLSEAHLHVVCVLCGWESGIPSALSFGVLEAMEASPPPAYPVRKSAGEVRDT